MIRLDHYPEPVSPTGNIASEGIRNQLGRPNMERLELLTRESVQNSWDARVDRKTVKVRIATQLCADEQLGFLKRSVFSEHEGFKDAGKLLKADQVRLLVISDRGTSGLGGPLRADRAESNEPHDFVDFLRDVGQPPDKKFGGGTFGYGKTALYLMSELYTILVYSRCRHGPRNQSRFIGAALGESFRKRGQKYTGRHWWGDVAHDGIVDPLLDEDADEAAERLGLAPFESATRGTTIAILQPRFGKRTAQQAMNYVVHALLWNFWPKMIAKDNGQPTMRFDVACDGTPTPVPNPETVAPFNGFVTAYRALDTASESDAFGWTGNIECHKPQQHLGRLSLRKFPRQARQLPELLDDQDNNLIPDRCHHVALLRVPELVVKYVEGPELHTEQLEYGGVFRADPELDRIYAHSEPPSHDDWVNKALEDWSEKRYIGSTFKRIEERLQEFAGPQNFGAGAGTGSGISLGRLGQHLSSLLPAHDGPGAGGQRAGDGGGSGKRRGNRQSSPRARISIVAPARLIEVDGQAALRVEFELRHAAGSAGTTIRANPAAVLDSGEREREPPEGSPVPEVLHWSIGPRTDGRTAEFYIANDGGEETESGFVLVSVPPDTTVGVELTASANEGD